MMLLLCSPVLSPSSESTSANPSPAIPIQSLEIHLPLPPKQPPKPHPMLTRSKAKGLLSNPHCLAVTTSPSAFLEPTTYQEAFQTPAWTQAMNDEFQALQNQHT